MLALALPLTFHWCYAFILLSSSATTGNTKLFESGKGYTYQLTSTVILNEPAGRKGKDVGYQIQGDVSLGVVWQNGKDKNEKLLELEVSLNLDISFENFSKIHSKLFNPELLSFILVFNHR